MSRPVRVCFFAPFLWPLWSEGRIPFAGGAEVQQARLARGLAERGFEMSVVSLDYGQADDVVAHGVRVLKCYRREAGLPIVRFFWPRLAKSMAALRRARAEVYYVRGAQLEAGVAYEAARSVGAAFVFGAAHDHDARASLPLLRNPRDRAWYRRALGGAAAVVAQTEFQRSLFKAEFGIDSLLIRNLVDVPERASRVEEEGAIVWLATYKPAKRPEWFLELARALPHRRFVMAGVVPVPPETLAAWQTAQAATAALPNLEVRGHVDHDRLAELFDGAALFVHTSPAEGFPNTVLEAWSWGIPTLTCVDPDGVIERERLGEVVATAPALAAAAEQWMRDPLRRREAGARARSYVQREHAPGVVLDRLGELFTRAARGRGTSDARRPSTTE